MKTKFRLYKRDDAGREMARTSESYKLRAFYFKFTHKGQCFVRCLETPDSTEAQRRARIKYHEITDAINRGQFNRLDATKLRHEHTAPIAQLITAYTTGPAEASIATRKTNINALKVILGETAVAGTLREIHPSAIRAYFERVTTTALAEPDQQQANSHRRSANSTWAKARSLFTGKSLQHYHDREIINDNGHSALVAFVRAGELAKFSGRAISKVQYNPPTDEIIHSTLTAWETLGTTGTDANIFLAIGHELAFGLRIAEFAQARWDWHTIRAGYPVLDASATVKSGTGLIQVRALDPWFSTMKRLATARSWWPDKTGTNNNPIITGTDAYRTAALFRAVSDWLRALGWKTMKTNHALRAYAGGQVAMKFGIYEAQMFLRHSTVKVTEQNYSHFIQTFKPADLETIPARWAVVRASGQRFTNNRKINSISH